MAQREMHWTMDGDDGSWSEWASRLAASPAWDLINGLISKFEPGRQGWALDIGCGTGRAFEPLSRKGYQTIGIDPIWAAAQASCSRARKHQIGAWAVMATAEMLPVKQKSVQAVLAVCCLFHLGPDELENALLEIKRVLIIGGEAIVHFLEIGDWRQALGKPGKIEDLPRYGYKAVVTGFFTVETMHELIRKAGLTVKEQMSRVQEDEQGERRDWFFHCVQAA